MLSKRDCLCNFKWPFIKKDACPIYSGALNLISNSEDNVIFLAVFNYVNFFYCISKQEINKLKVKSNWKNHFSMNKTLMGEFILEFSHFFKKSVGCTLSDSFQTKYINRPI